MPASEQLAKEAARIARKVDPTKVDLNLIRKHLKDGEMPCTGTADECVERLAAHQIQTGGKDLLECDVCHGFSAAAYEDCPFCGAGDGSTGEAVEEFRERIRCQLGFNEDDELEEAQPVEHSVGDILRGMRERPTTRLPSGFSALDAVLGGGISKGSIVVAAGAPGSGKTTFSAVEARRIADRGIPVWWLAADEPAHRIAVRMAQQDGTPRATAELGQLSEEATAVHQARPFRFVSLRHGFRRALADVVIAARQYGGGVLVVDSITRAPLEASSPRERVSEVMSLLRAVTEFGLTVLATSEANRAHFRSKAKGDAVDPRASPSESSAVEYGCDLLLVMTDVGADVRVDVVKNRDGERASFLLSFDRERHLLTEVGESNQLGEDLLEQRILSWLSEHGGVAASKSALVTSLKANRAAVLRAVDTLVGAGKVTTPRLGRGQEVRLC